MMACADKTIELISLCERPEASVIIPHFYQGRKQNFAALIQDIKNQTFKTLEIVVVNGVSPQGRAINLGAKASKGNLWVVMDDDSRMGGMRA